MPEIKKMGFASVINLREAQEPGADIDKHRAAAEAAGLRYYHVPFNGAKPDPKVADQFVKIISSTEAAPAFIHCASAQPRVRDVAHQAHRRGSMGRRPCRRPRPKSSG